MRPVLGTVGLVLLAGLTFLTGCAVPAFVFKPTALKPDSPAHWGFPQARLIRIQALDGSGLVGWWSPPASEAAPVILFLHGRSENISTRAKLAERLVSEGFGFLLFDYRGYGASEGQPSEDHLFEDSISAYDWLRSNGVAPGQIVVLGQSLGNAPASHLAAARDVCALALTSPYTNLPEAIADTLFFPPAKWLPWRRNRFDVAVYARKLNIRVILIVSGNDGLVPMRNSKRLAAGLKHPPIWIEADQYRHDGLLEGAVLDGRVGSKIREAFTCTNQGSR